MANYRSVVKWFDAKKGYGFIVHPEGNSDIFAHYSQIMSDKRFKTLRTGQVVDFSLMHGNKGLHAHSIVPLDETVAVEDIPAFVTNNLESLYERLRSHG